MAAIMRCIRREESGQDLIEYSLLVALVAIMAAAVPFQTLRPLLDSIFGRVTELLVRFGG